MFPNRVLQNIKQEVTTLALTPKMMKFCDEYLRTENATEAYIAAYNWGGGKSGAQVESSRLLARDDIQAYIMKLRKPVEKAVKRKMMKDKQDKIELIKERIAECVERGDDAAIARYIELWNKMDGTYSNANGDGADNDADIAGLDTVTLQLLAKAE